MNYYKTINLDFYNDIVSKSLDFVKQYPEIYYRKRVMASLYNLPLGDYLTAVPEVTKSFIKYGLICNRAAVYVMYNNSHTSLHKDGDYPKARINIPLLNCKNTYTKFYSNVLTEKWVNPDSGVVSYKATNSDFILADKVEIDSPTVLRISEPHIIEMDENNSPRICLTLGFNKDPVFLLE